MDSQTAQYYSEHAVELAERYEMVTEGVSRYFAKAFEPGMRVLDVGAGSGRDTVLLQSMGCDAYGIEPCDALLVEAIRRYPNLQSHIISASLPNPGDPFGGKFDGVLCSAVLMHLPKEQIFDAAFALRNLLKPGGIFLLSVPYHRPNLDAGERDDRGRLFTTLEPDYLELLFERLGFTLTRKWFSNDGLSRAGHQWCTLLFYLHHGESTRPVDQIEGILSRDKKTATYKLALFRALCELAVTAFGQAQWLENSMVGVPLDVVAEKWLFYYWPIFASPSFIPQIRGETEACSMPIAFRNSLRTLIDCYQAIGGLGQFTLDYRNSTISPMAKSFVSETLVQISRTIVKGPVTYAGGALETGRVFSYEAHRRLIVMSASLWHDLSLLGHWIEQAILLRWAELTSEISRHQVRTSDVIELLLTMPLPERNVADARGIYQQLSDRECVWTAKRIPTSFAVDHVIPFSLWHNNDLWNLMPVTPSVNSAKSDRLPTHNLVLRRKECLIHYWHLLKNAYSLRFEFELSRLGGISTSANNWQDSLFHSVSEALEVTAIQRGSERWEP